MYQDAQRAFPLCLEGARLSEYTFPSPPHPAGRSLRGKAIPIRIERERKRQFNRSCRSFACGGRVHCIVRRALILVDTFSVSVGGGLVMRC